MKAIVFGCGKVGVQVKQKLESEGVEIIAFSDNDDQKWDRMFEGYKIISPNHISNYQYDLIAIGIYKAADVVKKQLIDFGIPLQKIIIPIQPCRIFSNPNPVLDQQLERLDPAEYQSNSTKDYLKKKIVIDDHLFLNKLEDLKQTLKYYRIPRSNVCIVSGGVLQAYGVRKSKKFDDIDIIMTSDLRKVYGTGLVIVSLTAEMHPKDEYEISDDEIIRNPQYHFVFQDLKFACLDIINKQLG